MSLYHDARNARARSAGAVALLIYCALAWFGGGALIAWVLA